MAAERFEILYTQEAIADLKTLRSFDQKKILDGIETHLCHEPTRVSRSRIKQMLQPFWSQYRLRVEDFRVYYDVAEPERALTVLRVLAKGTGETLKGKTHETN